MFDAIYTDQLCTDSAYRAQGLATKLLHEKQCTMTTIATMSFQSGLDLYPKLDYKIDFERKDYNKSSSCIFLSKKL